MFIDDHVPGVTWDAKYATADNFTGAPVDGYLAARVAGTRALCTALEAAQEKARALGFGLHLWDAYRPQRAVDRFLAWTALPEDGLTKARHYPNIDRSAMVELGYIAANSGHSRGGTVDLTLAHLDTGALAEMGGGYDLMDPVSHHGAAGVPAVAAANRRLLRTLMEDCGFRAYPWEWWHYTLEDEPYPDTYFDFPVAEADPSRSTEEGLC